MPTNICFKPNVAPVPRVGPRAVLEGFIAVLTAAEVVAVANACCERREFDRAVECYRHALTQREAKVQGDVLFGSPLITSHDHGSYAFYRARCKELTAEISRWVARSF